MIPYEHYNCCNDTNCNYDADTWWLTGISFQMDNKVGKIMIHRETHRNLSNFPIKYNAEGKRICQICDKVLLPSCRKYCSDKCEQEMWVRNSHKSLKTRVIFERGEKCEQCGLATKDLILDHKKPIAIGGEEFSKDNVWLLCKICNKEKTKKDMGLIAVERKIPIQQRRLGG
jgi:5-methylcytosine-specific restriction endonuclease McrA